MEYHRSPLSNMTFGTASHIPRRITFRLTKSFDVNFGLAVSQNLPLLAFLLCHIVYNSVYKTICQTTMCENVNRVKQMDHISRIHRGK